MKATAVPITLSNENRIPLRVDNNWHVGLWVVYPVGESVKTIPAKDSKDLLRLAALVTNDAPFCFLFKNGKHLRTMFAARDFE